MLCADLRWDELTHNLCLNNLCLTDEEIRNLKYQQPTKLLNGNPALVGRYFQYKVQVFFNEIVLDGTLGKKKKKNLHCLLNFKKEEVLMCMPFSGF